MLSEQINAIKAKEAAMEEELEVLNEEIKILKTGLAQVRKARKTLEKLETQMNGETTGDE